MSKGSLSTGTAVNVAAAGHKFGGAPYGRAWREGAQPRAYLAWKHMLDLVILALSSPLWGPLLLVIALAIKLESRGDPVMYTQERTGRYGRRFNMHKFRTMVPNAEAMKTQLLHLNERTWPEFKMTNDPRVTRVGRVLRPLHLDELAQIWDVICGDMSLVGPRPTSARPAAIHDRYRTRLSVPPGITGMWQITQSSGTVFDEHMKLDVLYVQRMSLPFDLLLLARTALMLVFGRFKC